MFRTVLFTLVVTLASAPAFAAQPDSITPVLYKAVVTGGGSELTLVYTENNSLDTGSAPAATDFAITATNSGAITVNTVTVKADNTITLALTGGTVLIDDTVTLDYTPGTNPIQDGEPNLAAALVAQSVSISALEYNSTYWTPISPSGGTQYDYFVDQQTGQGEGDIIGDGGSNPGFQVHFDDNGSASNIDGTLSFRFRLAKGGSNYYIVGIDADLDGAIDVFVKMDTTNANEISIYANGGDLNISPSTTDIGAELYVENTTAATLVSSAVTDIDSTAVVADLDGDTNTDFYVSGSLSFNELVTALAGLTVPITLIDTDPLRYAVATSVNGNTFNQDIAGLPKEYDVDADNWHWQEIVIPSFLWSYIAAEQKTLELKRVQETCGRKSTCDNHDNSTICESCDKSCEGCTRKR